MLQPERQIVSHGVQGTRHELVPDALRETGRVPAEASQEVRSDQRCAHVRRDLMLGGELIHGFPVVGRPGDALARLQQLVAVQIAEFGLGVFVVSGVRGLCDGDGRRRVGGRVKGADLKRVLTRGPMWRRACERTTWTWLPPPAGGGGGMTLACTKRLCGGHELLGAVQISWG